MLSILIGSAPNDGTGDPLRTAMNKVNLNFAESVTSVASATPGLVSLQKDTSGIAPVVANMVSGFDVKVETKPSELTGSISTGLVTNLVAGANLLLEFTIGHTTSSGTALADFLVVISGVWNVRGFSIKPATSTDSGVHYHTVLPAVAAGATIGIGVGSAGSLTNLFNTAFTVRRIP